MTVHVCNQSVTLAAPVLVAVAMAIGMAFMPSEGLALDLNQATWQELQTLPGVGPKMAQRIVSERQRGPFESLAHLAERVSGLGAKRIERLRSAGLKALHSETARANTPSDIKRSGAAGPTSDRISQTHTSITPEIWPLEDANTRTHRR